MRLSANNDGQQVTTVSLRHAIERTDFHFVPPGIIPYIIKEHGPPLRWSVVEVWIDSPAIMIPPSAFTFWKITTLCCTGITMVIIIIIICGELPAIVKSKRVSRSDTSKSTNSQWVLCTSISYFKHIIMKVGSGLVLKFKINPEFPLANLGEIIKCFRPYQNSPLRSAKPFSQSLHGRLKFSEPSTLLCITVHPPSAVVESLSCQLST